MLLSHIHQHNPNGGTIVVVKIILVGVGVEVGVVTCYVTDEEDKIPYPLFVRHVEYLTTCRSRCSVVGVVFVIIVIIVIVVYCSSASNG